MHKNQLWLLVKKTRHNWQLKLNIYRKPLPVPKVRKVVQKPTILFPDVFDTHVYKTRNNNPTKAATKPIASNTWTDRNQSTSWPETNEIVNYFSIRCYEIC